MLFVSLITFHGLCLAQNLVVDVGSNMFALPWMTHDLSAFENGSCNAKTFEFDLNKDGKIDLEFSLSCTQSGWGSSANVQVTTSNGFYVHIDTAYLEYYQTFDTNNELIDTTRLSTVAQKYLSGDTLTNSLKSTIGLVSQYSWTYNQNMVTSNVSQFLLQTAFLVFENDEGQFFVLKIYMPSRSVLHILDAQTNAPLDYFQDIWFYPNPVNDVLTIFEPFEEAVIYTLAGAIVATYSSSNANFEIDLNHLAQGVYILAIRNEGTYRTQRFLKN